jgi:N-acetylmuramoyl-L-alanine amidase
MPSDAGSIPAASKKPMKSFQSRERNHILMMVLSLVLLAVFARPLTNNILKLSTQDLPDRARLIIETSFPLTYTIEKSGSFLMVQVQVKSSFKIQQGRLESGFVKSLSWAKGSEGYTLVIEAQSAAFRPMASTQNNLQQLTIDLLKEVPDSTEPVKAPAFAEENVIQEKKPEEKKAEPIVEPPPQIAVQAEAQAPSPEKRTVPPLPSKKIKTIVIDPGHGGLEIGAKGKFGNLEKDITLTISQKLKGLIEKNLAFRVVLTRDKDIDVSLENRAAVANNIKADL